MANTEEYLSENEQRHYPFKSSIEGVSSSIPENFIVSLRLFLCAYQQINAWLSRVDYDDVADEYTLTFSDTSGDVLSGSVSRRDLGTSRVFTKTVISSGEKVCLFTPGDLWDSPSWGGSGSWTINWNATESTIEPSVILPGPSTIKRIIIENNDPFSGSYPLNAIQQIIGGYNVGLFVASPSSFLNDGAVSIEAGPGLGLGHLAPEEVPLTVSTINGVAPDEFGNINLSGFDCLRVSSPDSNGTIIPNTLQIDSDCSPCCPCSQYQNMSNAIARRSVMMKAVCEELAATQEDAAQAYAMGLDYIKTHRKNVIVSEAAIARDVMVDGEGITFTVQNQASYEAYIYVCINLTGSTSGLGVVSPVSATHILSSVDLKTSILNDTSSLTPLLADGFGSYDVPENISKEFGYTIRLGYPKQDGQFHPFPSGASCAVKILTTDDIRSDEVSIKIRTVARFGKFLLFGRVGHSLSIKISDSGESCTLLKI